MNVPLWTLAGVLLLIAFRRCGPLRLAIWQIVLGGALLVVATGSLSLRSAWQAIDWEVIGFLFGVFVLGQALVESGLLERVSGRLLMRVRSIDGLLLAVLVGSGLASAVLMNDTLAVIGTPLMLTLARTHSVPPTALLLALAFGITIGSVMSPIGNPQNLLIALHGGIEHPFLVFFGTLALPTLLNLLLAWGVLRLTFRGSLHGNALVHAPALLRDAGLARVAVLGLGSMLAVIAIKVTMATMATPLEIPLWLVAAAAATPILLGSPQRKTIIAGIDWHTLIFFAALFVLVRAVFESGVVQEWLASETVWLIDVPRLLVGGTLLSQVVSNVPLVALALPFMQAPGTPAEAFLALSVGSTIAGNLTLMGAASNVIIVQAAERRGHHHLGFWRFFAVGAPLTLVNLIVYRFFL